MSNNKQLKYTKENYIRFTSIDGFSLGTKTVSYFQGINITLFLKNKHIFQENLYYSLFGNTFR